MFRSEYHASMASIVASLTMALPEEQVPDSVASLDDLSPLYKDGESLVTHSRSNWLQWAIHQTEQAYGQQGLRFLAAPAATLTPAAVATALHDLDTTLAAIRREPQTLLDLLLPTGEPAEILLNALDAPVGAWGPLYESDDGDEPAYLISFLCALRALLQLAAEQNLHVVHGWTAD